MKFQYENTDVCYVNAIRRIILADIPNVAIVDDMNFINNSTPLHNEFMSHRISLIPCCFSKIDIDDFDPTSYLCIINVENKTNDIKNVTTKDIQMINPQNNGKPYSRAETKIVFPPSTVSKDYILITKLKPMEILHVEFRMAKDIAKSHAKWSPVSLCAHHYMIDEDEVAKQKAELPKEKLNQFETINKWRMFKKNKYGEPNSFELNVESECRMTGNEIVDTATKILKQSLKSVCDKMKIEAIDDKETENMYAVVIHGEDHTIGNVIQATIFNNYIRKKDKIVEYCGFFKPHPLENLIVVKIKFAKVTPNVKDFFESAMKKAIEDIPVAK